MNRNAIVTLAIGEQYLTFWRKFCSVSWHEYAKRHNLDLIVITEPLAKSQRSAPWNKCLVLSQPFAIKHKQIAIIDSDIAINADAPSIFDQVPETVVGGVLNCSHIHDDLKCLLLSRLTNVPLPYELGPIQWNRVRDRFYQRYRLAPIPSGMINTGVLVATPERHAGIFRTVFDSPCQETELFEQIHLSHSLLSAGLFQAIDTRFNSVLYETLLVHHYYLFTQLLGESVTRAVVRTEFSNNFFLHFSHNKSLIRFLAD